MIAQWELTSGLEAA